MIIPKNIIFIIPSWQELSQDQRNNLDVIRRNNPGWNQIVMSDEDSWDFVAKHYSQRVVGALNKIDKYYGPAISDLLRYLVLNKLGGVYVDNKSGFSKPLDEIVKPDDEYIVAQWDNGPGEISEGTGFHKDTAHVSGGEYVNWVIISRPGHPFLEAVIEKVVSNIERYSVHEFGSGKIGVLRTTGPIAMTLAISEILQEHPHRMARCANSGMLYAADGNGSKHSISHRLHYSHLCHPVVIPSEADPFFLRLLRRVQMPFLIWLAKIKQMNRHRIYRARLRRGGKR